MTYMVVAGRCVMSGNAMTYNLLSPSVVPGARPPANTFLDLGCWEGGTDFLASICKQAQDAAYMPWMCANVLSYQEHKIPHAQQGLLELKLELGTEATP